MSCCSWIRTVLVLGRASNLPTVWSNILAAWLIAGFDDWVRLPWLLPGGTLVYIGGTALNDAFDAEFDRKYRLDRPIASGRVSAKVVWVLGGVSMTVGTVLLGISANWVLALGLTGCVFLYDWLHKRWFGSVWIMGACRSLLVLCAGSPPGGWPPALVIGLAVALLFYTVGITCAARSESGPERGAGRKWYVLLALPAAVVPGMTHLMGESITPWNWGAIAVASLIFAGWLFFGISRLRVVGGGKERIGRCVSCLLAGMPLVDMLFVVPVWGWTALIWMGFVPLCLLAQRFVPAT